jgi:hypothetical protein
MSSLLVGSPLLRGAGRLPFFFLIESFQLSVCHYPRESPLPVFLINQLIWVFNFNSNYTYFGTKWW